MGKMTDVPRIDEHLPCDMPDGHWIDSWGREVWVKDGEYHRTDGPAAITYMGSMYWYKDGKQHRADGPAVIHPNGEMEWRLNGAGFYFENWLKANNEITDKQRVLIKLKYG